MAQQPGGEFASAKPTKGEENAGFQERGIRAKIALNACRRLQHVQRPTPSHFGKNTLGFSSLGHRQVTRGRRCGVTKVVKQIIRAHRPITLQRPLEILGKGAHGLVEFVPRRSSRRRSS